MGLEDADLQDDGDAAGGGKAAVSVSCSICLEVVTDSGDRAWAKLQCGHQFHLDCIGSAFNVKGVMQCPNCRKIEKGQWLYANGCRPYPDFTMDEWAHDDDVFDINYSESSLWCPFGGFTRIASAFDEEFPPPTYNDLLGQHTVFTEHASASNLCPYIAYVQPLHPSSSSSNSGASGAADGGPIYNSQWNGQSGSSEMPNSYALPTMDVHYHNFFPTSSTRVSGPDQLSMPRRAPRSGSYVHPFLVGQSSAARAAPNSVGSSMIHPYPGSAARARERSQALQAYFQQPSSLPVVRSNGQVQVGSSSEHAHGGIYFLPPPTSGARSFQEAESSMPNPFHHIWERDAHPFGADRDPVWGPFRQAGGGSFRPRHGSDRAPFQGHYRS